MRKSRRSWWGDSGPFGLLFVGEMMLTHELKQTANNALDEGGRKKEDLMSIPYEDPSAIQPCHYSI